MGLSVLGAIFFTLLAYIAQSPRTLVWLGLVGYHLELRVKVFTGYALACLLLLLGFFLAGVPLGPVAETAVATPTTIADINQPAGTILPITAEADSTHEPTSQIEGTRTPSSGAFGGPPPGAQAEETPETTEETPASAALSTSVTDPAEPASATPTPNNEFTPTPVTATPTPTVTPSPTATPTPTITPTPIDGDTAVIDIGSGTIWVYRSPGGQQLVVVEHGDTVIVENGRANRDGRIWQKIRTVKGITGWVEEQFLVYEE
ncbi:MAG TPA: SH3 domain-containing protein [Anaerolineae bacterium]|nr:SH3 domain-containing protein [Anaerolineae bacterium]